MVQKITSLPRLDPAFSRGVLAALCIFFFLAGCLFIPLLGIQNDEALFGDGIYGPSGAIFFQYRHSRIPIMLISYLGTLKSWFYRELFHFWTPSAASVRTPVLVAGIATVCLCFVTVRRAAGQRAAIIAAILLATDATFLLTTCLDWGPVALQHLLLWGALALLLQYSRRRRLPELGIAFFLLGLALWDKALFIWSLGGLGVATLAVFPRVLAHLLAPRRIIVIVPAFCLGSLPLIIYNVQHPLDTFRSNASWDASDLKGKSELLGRSLEGSAMFGWLSPPDNEVRNPQPPRTPLERFAFWIAGTAGRRESSLGAWALVAAILLFPLVLWRERGKPESPARLLWFVLIFMIVAWLQMALTKGTGGGVHHAVLLWPFPQVFIAILLATVSRWVKWGKFTLVGILALISIANVLVINQHYVDAVRNGGGVNWTDAIYPLKDYLRQVQARQVFVVDWGILDVLRLLDRGRLPLRGAIDASTRLQVEEWLSDSRGLFVAHTDGLSFFPDAKSKLRQFAGELGYRPEIIRVIQDRHHRDTFEVYRFVR